MKLYFASTLGEHLTYMDGRNCLVSYFYSKNSRIDLKEFYKMKNYFIDCGAFTAFTQGKTIDIDEYCKWIVEREGHYDIAAALDVIGDGEKSYSNACYMRDKYDLHVLPCFHYGDDFQILKDYCKEWDYVALGGLVGGSPIKLKMWLDSVFSMFPKHKFHGFGVTNTKIVNRYPWESVDSSSWVMGSKSGTLFDVKLGVKYFQDLTEIWKLRLKELGFSHQRILDEWRERLRYNLINYTLFQDQHNTTEFKIRQPMLDTFFKKDDKCLAGKGCNQNYCDHYPCYKVKMDLPKEFIDNPTEQDLKEEFGNIPSEIALKLWRHKFGSSL